LIWSGNVWECVDVAESRIECGVWQCLVLFMFKTAVHRVVATSREKHGHKKIKGLHGAKENHQKEHDAREKHRQEREAKRAQIQRIMTSAAQRKIRNKKAAREQKRKGKPLKNKQGGSKNASTVTAGKISVGFPDMFAGVDSIHDRIQRILTSDKEQMQDEIAPQFNGAVLPREGIQRPHSIDLTNDGDIPAMSSRMHSLKLGGSSDVQPNTLTQLTVTPSILRPSNILVDENLIRPSQVSRLTLNVQDVDWDQLPNSMSSPNPSGSQDPDAQAAIQVLRRQPPSASSDSNPGVRKMILRHNHSNASNKKKLAPLKIESFEASEAPKKLSVRVDSGN